MKRAIAKKKKKAAFTLLELIIAVAIIAGIAAIAMPAYSRYIYTAKEAEMIHALGQLYREMERIKIDASVRDAPISYTQYFYSTSLPYFIYRPAAPRFNLVLGNLNFPQEDPNGLYALSQLEGYTHLQVNGQPSVNENFGINLKADGKTIESVMYGAEANFDGDDNFHILAVNQHGAFFKLCDDASDSAVGSDVYQLHSRGVALRCSPEGSGGGGGGGGGGGCQHCE